VEDCTKDQLKTFKAVQAGKHPRGKGWEGRRTDHQKIHCPPLPLPPGTQTSCIRPQ